MIDHANNFVHAEEPDESKPTKPVTPEQALVFITEAVAESIHDLGSVPSGYLYAQVMGYMSVHMYTTILDALIKAKLIKIDKKHLITWIGPKKS